MNRYCVYPVADRMPHMRAGGCGLVSSKRSNKGTTKAAQGVCAVCSEPVWFLEENLRDRALVCWPCAKAADAAA